MSEQQYIIYEEPAEKVARIVIDRPEARNAQNAELLYQLNTAFDRAALDDNIRVIILAANGPHFSAGHDLRQTIEELGAALERNDPVGTWRDLSEGGAAAIYSVETEHFLGLSERWRNIPKPSIAQVQGKCIAGGLLLAWPCDLIIAAEDAEFQDNTLAMGIPGVEYFAHPWELGCREGKERLFTGAPIGAADALRLGMVNHVVPLDQLETKTLELAKAIASKPAFALKLAKQSVNQSQDAAGRSVVMQSAFASHQLAHSQNLQVHGSVTDPEGISSRVVKDKKARK